MLPVESSVRHQISRKSLIKGATALLVAAVFGGESVRRQLLKEQAKQTQYHFYGSDLDAFRLDLQSGKINEGVGVIVSGLVEDEGFVLSSRGVEGIKNKILKFTDPSGELQFTDIHFLLGSGSEPIHLTVLSGIEPIVDALRAAYSREYPIQLRGHLISKNPILVEVSEVLVPHGQSKVE